MACSSGSRATNGGSRRGSGRWAREVVSAGLVDTPQGARAAGEALRRTRRAPPRLHGDLCDVVPGAAAVQAVEVPVVVLNLQPMRTSTTRESPPASRSRTARHAASGTRGRAGASRVPYRTVTAMLLEDDPGWDCPPRLARGRARRTPAFARATRFSATPTRDARHYSDLTRSTRDGRDIEVLELDDLVARVESAGAAAIERMGDRDP